MTVTRAYERNKVVTNLLKEKSDEVTDLLKEKSDEDVKKTYDDVMSPRIGKLIEEFAEAERKRKHHAVEAMNHSSNKRQELLNKIAIDLLTDEAKSCLNDKLKAISPTISTSSGVTGPGCCVCYTGKVCVAVVPCGHLCFCGGSCFDDTVAAAVQRGDPKGKCPICRKEMDSTLPIFASCSVE